MKVGRDLVDLHRFIKMLQIRLSNKATASESGVGAKLPSGETVTVACPDHLVLAELPVAKSLGSANGVTHVKTVGRRSRRPLGERVHFCVQCDFPIAIYGRLIPCEHAYCLDCARSDSICYLCDERIQKIQTIKMMEGIFICAAPHCLKSFLKKTEFESHVHGVHADLVNQNESEAKKPTTSDSRPVQDGLQPPLRPLIQQPKATPQQMDNRPHGFDGHLQQQSFEAAGGQQHYVEYPLQPPNFVVPVNPTSYASEAGGEQGSLLGYPQPWNGAMMMSQGGFFPQGGNAKDSRGILAATPSLPPPPPPLPPPFVQMPGNFFGDGQGYGWQQDKRDAFGNTQD